MADWSLIPSDLLRLIADKLSAIEDYAALKSACRSFRSAADNNMWRPDGVSRPPWLLLCSPEQDDDRYPINERGLLSMYKNRKKFHMNLPELHGRHCWGSPHGWIVTLGLDRQLHLFNPLNRRRILLPQPDIDGVVGDGDEESVWMRMIFIDRAILIRRSSSSSSSSSSDDEDFIVVTMDHGCHLRVLRHHSWETIKFSILSPDSSSPGYVFDVARYNGNVYVLGIRGRLFLCSDWDSPDPLTAGEIVLLDCCSELEGDEKLYLVESFGDLLMVVRIYECFEDVQPSYKTIGFQVYKLNCDTRSWIELAEDLGDCALFVGDCESVALPQPEAMNCRRNCIYFTDDNFEHFGEVGGHDMGIYDFEKFTIDSLYEGDDSLSSYSTPTWLIPSFT